MLENHALLLARQWRLHAWPPWPPILLLDELYDSCLITCDGALAL